MTIITIIIIIIIITIIIWGGGVVNSHSLQFFNFSFCYVFFLFFFSYLSLNIPVWCSLFLVIRFWRGFISFSVTFFFSLCIIVL